MGGFAVEVAFESGWQCVPAVDVDRPVEVGEGGEGQRRGSGIEGADAVTADLGDLAVVDGGRSATADDDGRVVPKAGKAELTVRERARTAVHKVNAVPPVGGLIAVGGEGNRVGNCARCLQRSVDIESLSGVEFDFHAGFYGQSLTSCHVDPARHNIGAAAQGPGARLTAVDLQGTGSRRPY